MSNLQKSAAQGAMEGEMEEVRDRGERKRKSKIEAGNCVSGAGVCS